MVYHVQYFLQNFIQLVALRLELILLNEFSLDLKILKVSRMKNTHFVIN
jgi:hypothetical protein